jgi:hypothetical protein
MSATPRIVFSTFRSSADPMFLAWTRFLQTVEGAARRTGSVVVSRPGTSAAAAPPRRAPMAHAVVADGACGVWRILASNNRELGRSARAYTSYAAARQHVISLRAGIDGLRLTTVSGERTGMHGWYLSQGRQPVITCGRWYGAAASGTTAAFAAIDALGEAEIEQTVRRLEPPRRTGAVADDVVW